MATNNSTNNDQLTTNGQLLIGSTSATPVVATLSAGTGITITNGAGSISIASSGGSSALTWIASITASSSASVSFSNDLTATYDNYLVIIENYVPATNNTVLQLRVGTGSTPTYQTSSYVGGENFIVWGSGAYGNSGTPAVLASGTGAMDLVANESGALISNSSTGAGMGTINVTNANNATNYKTMSALMSYYGNGSVGSGLLSNVACGQWQAATVLTSLRFISSSGNLSTGTFKLYGYQN
jgi:hypothetical protein